jgi:hypothetical protein
MHVKRLGMHAKRFHMLAKRPDMHVKRLGMHVKRLGMHVKRPGMHAKRLGMHAKRFDMHAKRINIGWHSLGIPNLWDGHADDACHRVNSARPYDNTGCGYATCCHPPTVITHRQEYQPVPPAG